MTKLGIIGMSEGNGHPYSWSAIINGYDHEAMASCPFSVIPDYLGKEKYPDNFIEGSEVTHIWTQDPDMSEHTAKAAKIEHIVKNSTDMIGQVDAILHARDDYQNHKKFTRPFIEAGLPIYIDKPLANSVAEAEKIFSLQKREDQIFTCSALRYSRELEHLKPRVQNIVSITAHTPKSWSLYSIHIINPVVGLLGNQHTYDFVEKKVDDEKVTLKARYQNVDLTFQSAGIAEGTINLTITFTDGTTENIIIKDMFYAFRSALEQFLLQAQTGKASITKEETMACIGLIEMGKDND